MIDLLATSSKGRRQGLTSHWCPNSVSALGRSFDVCVGASDPIGRRVFSSTYNWPLLAAGLRIRNAIFNLFPGRESMLGELMNIPTETLIDMLYIILAGEFAVTANDAAEVEQIQRELQRRGGEQRWSFQTVN